ncbi:MAG TPA: CTP synthase, partial [Bacteroidetes bacterium]|nr:CTP synthase [Bacteroidota bacterium]
MRKEKLDRVVLRRLKLPYGQTPELKTWKAFVSRLKNPIDEVRIGLVGKYVELKDAYKSIAEAIVHGGATNELKVKLDWIHSEDVNSNNAERLLGKLDAILVAPGFGERGIDGKIEAVRYAREQKIPFLGICLGMQVAVVEFGRNVLGLEDCNSTEFVENAKNPVISLMEAQKSVVQLGGSMRLGSYACELKKDSLSYKAYHSKSINERHRHRYEFNNDFRAVYEEAGVMMAGVNAQLDLVEIIELKDHPFYIASQFHPELKSTVENPHPLFTAFVHAAYDQKLRGAKPENEGKLI